ncbi:MAG: hypothetical protein ACRD2L_01655, partial [Terriglobia bacterium]
TYPMAVVLSIDGEPFYVTHFSPERRGFQLRYTFSAADYYRALNMNFDDRYSAEYPGVPANREEESIAHRKTSAEVAIKIAILQVVYNKEGRPGPGRQVVSTSYKIVLNCRECIA